MNEFNVKKQFAVRAILCTQKKTMFARAGTLRACAAELRAALAAVPDAELRAVIATKVAHLEGLVVAS